MQKVIEKSVRPKEVRGYNYNTNNDSKNIDKK